MLVIGTKPVKLYDLVYKLLERHPVLRDDDRKLIWSVWFHQGLTKKGHITKDEFVNMAENTESIRRVRQKIQEKYPHLRASQTVEQAREKKEDEMGTFVFREVVRTKPDITLEQSSQLFASKWGDKMRERLGIGS